MESIQNQQLTKKERRILRHKLKITKQQQELRKKNIKRIFLWSSVFVIIAISIFGIVKIVSRPTSDNKSTVTVNSIKTEDWVKGNREAKVILTEYSDFQCPACAFYYPVLKKISDEFGYKIAIVYRHFPLPNHQNAKIAAAAAEAAGQQGKFWEMHDIIFENQNNWNNKRNPKEFFINYADNLNLNLEKFKNDLESKDIKTKIENSYQESMRLGLNSTPTFFLNGKKIINPRNYEEFKAIINQAINENQ
jgi:protein-disulfide isomerase